MAKRTLIYGQVKLSEWSNYQLFDVIKELDKRHAHHEHGIFVYALGNVKFSNEHVYVELNKIRKSKLVPGWNWSKWRRTYREMEDDMLEEWIRLILTKDNKIVMEEKRPHMPRSTVHNVLQGLITQVVEATVRLELKFKINVEQLERFLENADQITCIEFDNMRIPNPIVIDGAENFENMIRRKIKKASFHAKEGEGIEFQKEPTLKAGIEASKKDYADIKLEGIIDGTNKNFDSKERIERTRIEIENDDDFIKKAKNLLR